MYDKNGNSQYYPDNHHGWYGYFYLEVPQSYKDQRQYGNIVQESYEND
jgi:hypothetical protein